MIEVLLPLCVVFFIALYMAFAFVNWDMAWVAHVDVIARCFFIFLFVVFILMFSMVYFEGKDKF